jgi:cell cycle sensor histidine kinase DivJ
MFWWHVGWLAATGVGAGLLMFAPLPLTRTAMIALAIGAAPALAGLALGASRQISAQVLIILNWGLGVTVAVALAGGVMGPLSAWLLAPMAAAVVMGRIDRLALGAAVSLGAVGLVSLAGVALVLPPPVPALAYGMSVLCLMTIAAGFAIGLVILQREVGRERVQQARVGEILYDQPNLVISVTQHGIVSAAWGHAPLGLGALPVVGGALADLAVTTERAGLHAALRRALEDGRAEVGFAPSGAPDGWASLDLLRVNQNRLVGVVRDASAQRAREANLERAKTEAEAQNAGKSRFLANMSHELRTPLNAIMGFSDIMRQRLFGPLQDRYADYGQLIHESGSHLLELINDVLDMSKIEAERFELAREEFDARDAVTGVLRLMRGQADRAGVQLRGLISREPLEVTADRRAIKQIVLNLISNALKFTPKPGSVTVTVRADGPMLELIVADTGVGIAADDLQRLGRPYEQAGGVDQRAAGTGLGLSLVRAFAELHGGTMSLESHLGEGTTVTVRLPVMEGPPAPAPKRETAGADQD